MRCGHQPHGKISVSPGVDPTPSVRKFTASAPQAQVSISRLPEIGHALELVGRCGWAALSGIPQANYTVKPSAAGSAAQTIDAAGSACAKRSQHKAMSPGVELSRYYAYGSQAGRVEGSSLAHCCLMFDPCCNWRAGLQDVCANMPQTVAAAGYISPGPDLSWWSEGLM
ncbi:hypothetical protein NDU88_003947 [Pleurodeles waltl]|uniref:Uncharacterized protein n=1 Tax=Pleurodeles waltl TaxID=8319 RepID=A0AAV7MF77_PLEWA|nr:hypothetical protein NDU88_003947 [Pleurodeles waltl]